AVPEVNFLSYVTPRQAAFGNADVQGVAAIVAADGGAASSQYYSSVRPSGSGDPEPLSSSRSLEILDAVGSAVGDSFWLRRKTLVVTGSSLMRSPDVASTQSEIPTFVIL